jgi:flagellum-specific peptidoglycan hydrolase FlgJ
MDYQKAKDLRSKSFSDLMTDKLTGGQGIGSSLRETLSEKTKAKMTGIKETFDPMNIVKTMTFGSKLGPALYGKMMGRSKEDMKYFTNKKTRGPGKNKTPGQIDSQADSMAVDALGLIYRLMLRNQEDEKLRREEEKGSIEERDSEEELRNQELVKALTGRRKKEKVKEKPLRDEKGRFAKKPTEEKPKPEPTKETPKKGGKKEEAPKPTGEKPKVEKAPTPKEAPKAPEKVPSKEVPKTEAIKPPSSAGKIAIVAGVGAAGVFSSSEAFAKTMMPQAERASQALGGKIPPVAILGQWAGESSNGKSVSAPFNYAGIKAGKNDKKGDYVLTEERYTDAQIKQAQASGETLHKVLGPNDTITKKGRQVTIDEWFGKGSIQKAAAEGKNWVQVKSYFAKFDSAEEFTDRYVQFLSSPRYAKARESTTPGQFGLEVAKAGYATASADTYSQHISDYAKKYPTLSSSSSTSSSSTGSQIDQSSKENKDLKESLNKDKPKQSTVNNTTVTSENKETKQSSESVDDRPAHLKKKG